MILSMLTFFRKNLRKEKFLRIKTKKKSQHFWKLSKPIIHLIFQITTSMISSLTKYPNQNKTFS